MTEGLWAAIIGVGGTILGTVLGFFLGKIDFGKLKVRIKRGKEEPRYSCDYEETVEKLYYIDCPFVISLYNGANKNKVFRDAKISFVDENKKEVLKLPLEDLQTSRCTNSMYLVDDIGTVNVPPKTGIDIKTKYITTEIEKLYRAKKVYLQYFNESFKTKSEFLWKCDYSKIELTRPVKKTTTYLKTDEEQNNG